MHALASQLESIVDPQRIRTARYDPMLRTPFYRPVDVPGEFRQGEPFTVVKVETAEEISHILRLANERRDAVYVRQGMGVIFPDVIRPEPPGSLVLDMSSMKWVRPNYDRAYVEIGPSVSEKELNNQLAPHGYQFPEFIGPVSWGGSMVCLNSSGRSVDHYIGKPRDYVLGLQAVLPTGEIVDTGTRGVRRPCGFDLTQLLVGGQCLFGVVTEVRLRLVPAPREVIGALVQFPSLETLGEGVASVYQSRAPYPRLMELMDRNYLELMDFEGERPAAVALVGADGDAPGEAEWKLDRILEVLRGAGATATDKASGEEWQRLLEFREGLLSKLNPRSLILLVAEVMDFPLDILPQGLAGTLRLQERLAAAYPGLYIGIVGHIGAGSLHPTFIAPLDWGYKKLRETAKHIRDEILDYKLANGASDGEQGIFPGHREWFLGYYGQEHWNLVQAIKGAVDPNNVLNPLRLTDMRSV